MRRCPIARNGRQESSSTFQCRERNAGDLDFGMSIYHPPQGDRVATLVESPSVLRDRSKPAPLSWHFHELIGNEFGEPDWEGGAIGVGEGDDFGVGGGFGAHGERPRQGVCRRESKTAHQGAGMDLRRSSHNRAAVFRRSLRLGWQKVSVPLRTSKQISIRLTPQLALQVRPFSQSDRSHWGE
jgi:hypothetical protein